jgi:hemolysin III
MLKKMDHMMIFVLIAGTYTPICTIAIGGRVGYGLLALVWGIAVVGITIKAFWIHCPKWFSSVLYIGMGWVCVLAFTEILNALSPAAFGWLLAGGIIYTIGGVIYALNLPLFDERHKNFGTHEIFHLFVMGGSACHFIVMYSYLAPMPLA